MGLFIDVLFVDVIKLFFITLLWAWEELEGVVYTLQKNKLKIL